MSDQAIICTANDGVAYITLNRPAQMNAFTDEMRDDLLQELERLSNDAEVRCIVIGGAGKAFCAGGDIASMAGLQERDDTTVLERRMMTGGQVVELLRRMPQPVIAAVDGPAAGGGMNLALACDLRIGSDRALFAESFVKIGLAPDWGGFSFLTSLVGTAKAMELMLTGDRVPADEALRLGLLNKVVPLESFDREVDALSSRLANGPAEALAAIKRGVYTGAQSSLSDALAFEFRAQRALFLSDDAREGMRAFLQKRPPEFGK